MSKRELILLIKKIILLKTKQIEEASTTAMVDGYATPFFGIDPKGFKKTRHSYSAYTREAPRTHLFFKPSK